MDRNRRLLRQSQMTANAGNANVIFLFQTREIADISRRQAHTSKAHWAYPLSDLTVIFVQKVEHEAVEKKKKQVLVALACDDPPKPTEIRKEITIILTETETWFQLDIPSTCVADDAPNLDQIKSANTAYLQGIKGVQGADKYSDKNVQVCTRRQSCPSGAQTCREECSVTDFTNRPNRRNRTTLKKSSESKDW